MTPAERRALAFFAAVAALGVGARAAGLGAPSPVALPGDGAGAERRALEAQLAAVDSARAGRQGRSARAGGRAVRARRGAASGAASADDGRLTPSPDRADTRLRAASAGGGVVPPAAPVDVDRADSAEFERLPGVGPALARRLVADRRVRGAFGSMAGLSRVPGIGPALEARLAPHVTFSGRQSSP